MKFLKKLSFVFIAILALFLSHSFTHAQHSYVGENEIVIDGIKYKNIETEFQKISTSPDGINPYAYDGWEYDFFPSLDGQTVSPTILCEDASQSKCTSIGTAKGTAIGEPVYGASYNGVSLWQKVIYDGKIYYVPLDVLSSNSINVVFQESANAIPVMNIIAVQTDLGLQNIYYQPITGNYFNEEEQGWFGTKWNNIKNWSNTKEGTGYKQIGLGILETFGGVAQIYEGLGIAIGGTIAGAGVSGVVAIPVGSLVVISGTTDTISGIGRIKTGLINVFGNNDEIIQSKGNIITNLINNNFENKNLQTAANITHMGVGFLSAQSMIRNSWNAVRNIYDEVGSISKTVVQLAKNTRYNIKQTYNSVKNNVNKLNPLSDTYKAQKVIEASILSKKSNQGKELLSELHYSTAGVVPEQPLTKLNCITAICKDAKISFDEQIKNTAKITGGEPITTNIKSDNGIKRVMDKIIKKFKGRSELLTDELRGTIVYKNIDELNAAINQINREFDIVKAKDRFAYPKGSGYRDVNIIVKNKNGALSELQLHTKQIYKAKQKEEKIYNKYRKFEDEVDYLSSKSKLTTQDQKSLNYAKQKIYERNQKSNDIYDKAWKKETGQYSTVAELKNTVSKTYSSTKATLSNAQSTAKSKLDSLRFWK